MWDIQLPEPIKILLSIYYYDTPDLLRYLLSPVDNVTEFALKKDKFTTSELRTGLLYYLKNLFPGKTISLS